MPRKWQIHKLFIHNGGNTANNLSPCQSEGGAALVISLMFLVILSVVGATAVILTTTDTRISANYRANTAAFQDADAGVNYAIAQMETGLKNGSFSLPGHNGDTSPISSFTAPSGFNFSYPTPQVLTRISEKEALFSFTAEGNDPNNTGAAARIRAIIKRKPAIQFGAFGDKLLDLGNTAAVYSYSHSDIASPGPGDSTGEGDVGSNESVILNNSSVVDGDVALGEDTAGNDAALTDHGGIVSGTNGEDIDRVDPDPLGVVGGEYAANFATYSVTNDNSDLSLVFSNSGESIDAGNDINLGNHDDLTLKGKAGGSNFYIRDISVGNKAVLYIDTTNGPVHIYLTGEINAVTGSEIVNTTGCGAGACSCCVWTPALVCSACAIGAPSDFAIFANSQSSTDTISIGNSVSYAGLIYAPYITVRMDNSADIYGAVFASETQLVNGVQLFYDTDLAEDYATKDLILKSWREVRN